MKKYLNIFTLSTSLLICWNSSTLSNTLHSSANLTDQIDLTGTWIAEGYRCERGGLVEKVQISVQGNYLVAKKITGDNCVPAGNITFQGTLPDLLSEGSSFPVTFIVGTPSNPASGTAPGQLRIIDANSFDTGSSTGEGITFKRSSQSSSQSNVSLAGTWQSDWGLVVFNSDLTGHWNQGSGVGQINDGTYDPKTRTFVFHYYQPWNDMNGIATLTLSEDGNRLSGTWTQQSGSNPPGSGGSGGWTMTRNP